MDSSGNHVDGKISGATYVPGYSGTALHFRGGSSDDNVLLPQSLFNGFGNGAYVEAWIRPSSYTASCVGTVFRKRADYRDFGLELTKTGALNAYLAAENGATGATTAAGAIPLNTWTKVAMGYDGSRFTLYINDSDVGHDDKALTINWATAYFQTQIGNDTWDDYNCTYGFAGDIDEVLIETAKPSTGSCSLTCTASAPTQGMAGNPVSFSATATASNCTGSPSYSWNFGDGSALGTQQNPVYTYQKAGSFGWTMTASAPGASCQQTGTIVMTSCPAPTLSQQPVPQTVFSGQQATLTVVVAAAGAVSYQWYQGSASDTSTPVGTNSASFLTPPLTLQLPIG